MSSIRVWTLVLAALIFGQFTAVSHAHDAHEEVPVACDVCIAAVSQDDEDTASLDDDPQPTDTGLDAIPALLIPKDEPSEPASGKADNVSGAPDEGRTQPRQTRAPPL